MISHASDQEILARHDRHRREPNVSPNAYLQALRIALGQEVAGKHRVYLDTCYWINLRDAMLGRQTMADHVAVLELLRTLVQQGRGICPVSDAAFVEVMQQSDDLTRKATASLMDELSGGVALATEKIRVRMELLDFLRQPGGDGARLADVAWVRPGLILGEPAPYHSAFDAATNAIVHKSLIDDLWGVSFIDLMDERGDQTLKPLMARSADRVNEMNLVHAEEISSFKDAWAHEVSGAVKFLDDGLIQAFLDEKSLKATPAQFDGFKDAMQALLFGAFRLRPEIMAQRAPTLYVHTACHATVRWDKARKVNGKGAARFASCVSGGWLFRRDVYGGSSPGDAVKWNRENRQVARHPRLVYTIRCCGLCTSTLRKRLNGLRVCEIAMPLYLTPRSIRERIRCLLQLFSASA